MKIQHLSFSSIGGAGSVGGLLAQHQAQAGHAVEFLTLSESNLWITPFRNPSLTALAAADNFLIKKPDFQAPVSLLRDSNPSGRLSISADVDIVHLHWMNGVLPTIESRVPTMNRPKLFWTLHDMNPFVGVCHYSLECDKYRSGCLRCPAVWPIFRRSVSNNFDRKNNKLANLNRSVESTTLIAPSNWIANAASLSPIFSGSRIEVLPQPIDSLFFNFVKRRVIRKPASQTRELTLGIVAANLGDPLKGVKKAVSLFKSIRRDGDRLFLVGSGGSELASDSARIISKGVLSGEALADVLVSLDALIVFSEYDNTPLVVSEALALGTPVIGKKVGGIPELVSHGTTGWLVSDEMGLAQTIQSLRSLDAEVIGRMSENCMIEARLKFHPTKVAQRHLDLYLE